MDRIFTNQRLALRANGYLVVALIAFVFGVFELYNAFIAHTGDSYSSLFGAMFLGGALYAAYSTWNDHRDLVAALDVDQASGEAAVTLWRPFHSRVLRQPLSAFSDWRHFVKLAGKSTRLHYLIVTVPGYERPVAFDLPFGKPVPDSLRRLAPEAVADFETSTGAKRSG